MQPIQRREWCFPLALAIAFAVVGSLPYLQAIRAEGPDETFMGFVGRGTPGANSYFAFSRQVAEGGMLTTNLYNPHAPSRAYFNPEWWIIGATARATGLSLTTLFHGERVLAAFAFLLAAYYLCAVVLATARHRRLALALVAFGGGFGWIVEALNAVIHGNLVVPADTQGVTLFAYLVNKPHFIRAGACAALQYAWLIRGAESGRWGFFCAAGLAASAHSLIRPYQIPEACLVLLLHVVARSFQDPRATRTAMLQAGCAILGHAPAIAWHAWILMDNPLGLGPMQAWQPMLLLMQTLWLGLPFCAVLVYAGLRCARGHWSPAPSIPVLWLAAAMLLLQAHPWFPWGVESYFPWVLAPPLLFVKHIVPPAENWLKARLRTRFLRPLTLALLMVLILPGNALNYARFFTALHEPVPPWRYYLPDDLLNGLNWLETEAAPESVILASHDTSQFVPRLADLRVVSGQDVLTDRYREANASVLRFFLTPGDDAFKVGFCREQRVSYVVIGPFERAVAALNPADHRWMRPVYNEGNIAIYRVELDRSQGPADRE
ncbi:MAG: hypothetical protein JNK74_04305 [Candidatus Hydrogenedentes bacterium]|nr:hypothetical protein [Candidatus Hydrogenedentota bacterium]